MQVAAFAVAIAAGVAVVVVVFAVIVVAAGHQLHDLVEQLRRRRGAQAQVDDLRMVGRGRVAVGVGGVEQELPSPFVIGLSGEMWEKLEG